MNLQNIVIDFLDNKFSTMFEDKNYELETIEMLSQIKTEIESIYDLTCDRAVIQLTLDQHYSEPRIIFNNEIIIDMLDIATKHSDIYATLKSIRLNIKTELDNLITNPIIL